MNKSQLRKIYLKRQKNLSNSERKIKSEQIADRFFKKFDLGKVQTLHCFIAIEKFNEIDTSSIFMRVWRDFLQIQTLVPRVNFDSDEIESTIFSAETKLTRNIWQIHEPEIGAKIEAEKIDLILVPLVCFDEKGFRLGYGKGFYDKLLKTCRKDCLKIGLSYFEPVREIGGVESFDVKLNYCLTPEKVWNFLAR